METKSAADPALVDLVTEVTNRFGIDGLDTIIDLATERRVEAQAALAALAEALPPVRRAG